MTVGEVVQLLKADMTKRGLNQSEYAKLAGTSPQSLSKVFLGKRPPPRRLLALIGYVKMVSYVRK